MMENGYSLSDIKAVTGGENGGFSGSNGWFWIVVLFLFMFGFGGNGGFGRGNDGAMADEFLKRDIFSTNQNVSNTACATQKEVLESRYTTQLGLQQLGAQAQNCCCATGDKILESRYDNALLMRDMQAQLAQCCCDLKTTMREEGAETRQLIQNNTIQDLRDKLADRDRDLMTSRFQNSQTAQSENIINAVRPFPHPAYITCSPYTSPNCGCGCGYQA